MIIVGILGAVFFGFLIHLMYPMLSPNLIVKGVSKGIGYTIVIIVVSIFCFFSVVSLSMALSFRIFQLNESELIISRPLLFFDRRVLLADIENLNEGDYKLNIVDNHSLTLETETIYNGRKITLNLKNGKQLKLNSFEVGGYKSFVKELKKQLVKLKSKHN
jgi:hypothetical protein